MSISTKTVRCARYTLRNRNYVAPGLTARIFTTGSPPGYLYCTTDDGQSSRWRSPQMA